MFILKRYTRSPKIVFSFSKYHWFSLVKTCNSWLFKHDLVNILFLRSLIFLTFQPFWEIMQGKDNFALLWCAWHWKITRIRCMVTHALQFPVCCLVVVSKCGAHFSCCFLFVFLQSHSRILLHPITLTHSTTLPHSLITMKAKNEKIDFVLLPWISFQEMP